MNYLLPKCFCNYRRRSILAGNLWMSSVRTYLKISQRFLIDYFFKPFYTITSRYTARNFIRNQFQNFYIKNIFAGNWAIRKISWKECSRYLLKHISVHILLGKIFQGFFSEILSRILEFFFGLLQEFLKTFFERFILKLVHGFIWKFVQKFFLGFHQGLFRKFFQGLESVQTCIPSNIYAISPSNFFLVFFIGISPGILLGISQGSIREIFQIFFSKNAIPTHCIWTLTFKKKSQDIVLKAPPDVADEIPAVIA